MNTDIQKLIRRLITDGYRVERGKHYKVYSKESNGKIIIISCTPGDGIAIKKIVRDLNKIGFVY